MKLKQEVEVGFKTKFDLVVRLALSVNKKLTAWEGTLYLIHLWRVL